jgi:hypothetical protein
MISLSVGIEPILPKTAEAVFGAEMSEPLIAANKSFIRNLRMRTINPGPNALLIMF